MCGRAEGAVVHSMNNRTSIRSGSALIYVLAALTIMTAFASLAVDWGRVQLVKTELQRAADAAARYGAVGLGTNSATAIQNAITAAADNTADGSSVVMTSDDVTVGNWNTTTRTFTANGTPLNAVQVVARRTTARGNAVPLTWARLLPGGPSTTNVGATATAVYDVPTVSKGFIGYNNFKGKNNSFGGSYNSSANKWPTIGTARPYGMFGTNGTLDGNNNGTLSGELHLGPDATSTGLVVNGPTRQLTSPIPYPEMPTWNPGTNPDSTPQAYSVGTAQLPGGTYWFTSLSIGTELTFTGPATIYVNGDVRLNGNLLAFNEVPSNLRIYVLGADRKFGDSGNNDMNICAQIIAPTTDLTAKNNISFRGMGYFDSITTKNNAEYFFDESAGAAGVSPVISLVR